MTGIVLNGQHESPFSYLWETWNNVQAARLDLHVALLVLTQEFHRGGISGDRAQVIAAIRRALLRLGPDTFPWTTPHYARAMASEPIWTGDAQ